MLRRAMLGGTRRGIYMMSWKQRYIVVGLIVIFLIGLRQMAKSTFDSHKETERFDIDNDYIHREQDSKQDTMMKDADNKNEQKPVESQGDRPKVVDDVLRRSIGLTAKGTNFLLNEKPFRILSGEIHYFRHPYQYWKDRLLALKACGLNTLTTYIPWNSHEPIKGTFDFTGMLDLEKFIKMADDLGIFVILRVGPYICAEWEWGGLPSWLLKESEVKIRTSDSVYMKHVRDWFDKLIPLIRPYQYLKGGPVIAVQVENEYASFPEFDPAYIKELTEIVLQRGINELLFVCDDRNGIMGKDPKINYGGLMKSINLQHNPRAILKEFQSVQPHMPMFVSEYWTGWFNWWGGKNNKLGVPWLNTLDVKNFKKNTKELLDTGASVNLYMFAGGTNFGFMNGGMITEEHRGKGDSTAPDTTSYDYSAPVAENGMLTEKYFAMRSLLQDLDPSRTFPEPPPQPLMSSYDTITVDQYVSLGKLLAAFKDWMIKSEKPLPMEVFPMKVGRKEGQSYGYALYEAALTGKFQFKLDMLNSIRDRALVFMDTIYQDTVTPVKTSITMTSKEDTKHTVSLLVENQGRINWVSRQQHGTMESQSKGIVGDIKCNEQVLLDWKTWPLEFDQRFMKKLNEVTENGSLQWMKRDSTTSITTPVLLKATLDTGPNPPRDTFVELRGFEKGVLFVNGVNVGRYWNSAGPQKRLYVPGAWLRPGHNDVMIFEEMKVGKEISSHESNGLT